MRKSILIMFFVMAAVLTAEAQPALDRFLRSGTKDATLILDAYMEPLAHGMSASMINGWYNTARPHKPLRFDATVMASMVYMPDALLTFEPDNLGLENIRLIEPSDGNVPTLMGGEGKRSVYQLNLPGNTSTFAGPGGAGIEDRMGMQAIPVPLIQAGIGVGRHTDIKVRYSPVLKFSGVQYYAYGAGIMHSISQYFRPGWLDVSILAGYTQAEMSYDLTDTGYDEVYTSNGSGVMTSSGWTVQGIASGYFEGITVYAGAGYYEASSDLRVKGTYELLDEAGKSYETLVDPVRTDYSQSGPRLTTGVQLEFAVITVHADYTFQRFNSLTLGAGLRIEWKQRQSNEER